MARLLRMPGVAANATDAVLAEWSVAEGDDFASGDALATVETDKALVDIEADAAGRVVSALVPGGSRVEVGAPIAVLGDPGETPADLDALLAELGVADAAGAVAAETPATDPGSAAPVAESPDVHTESPGAHAEPPRARAHGATRRFSSPLARKLAQQAGIPLAEIAGTGPRQRILRRDVEAARAARAAGAPRVVEEVAPRPSRDPATDAPAATDTPHSRVRQAVASRLQQSKQEAPHFYLRATVRAERLLEVRAEINDGDTPVRVSVNDLVLKAVAGAHARVPEMNVVWLPDAVRSFDTVDVAVAVATERGLLTPVVRDVGRKSVTEVAADVRDLAGRAREGRLKQDELEGGTISVSNLGMYGVEEFAAIINPPHAAILAVGAVRDEPVVEGGLVVAGKVMTVTVSVDHRPVDGAVAARWLAALTELLEHPVRSLA